MIPLGKLKRVLFIALLVVFGCEDKEQEKIYGCTDPAACNFKSDATIFDNSCIYEIADCNGECGGAAVEDICGTCDSDTTNDCIVSSIEEGEDVSTNAGLIIQFSESMDLNIFEADAIIDSFFVSTSYGTDILPLSIFIIQNSNYIKLNNELQTFYYDPSTFTCAFIQTTTVFQPEGTGEGFIIQEGDNEFKIGDEYLLNFTNNDVIEDIDYLRTVPNPSYYIGEGNILNFTHLPPSCIISIYTHLGEEIKSINHNNGNQYHSWDLKNEDGEDIDPGIYRYEVVYESFSFTNGVMVINEILQIDSSG